MFAVGDQVRIEIIAFGLPATWNVSILQGGTANAPATGKATKYLSLPYQYGCVDRKALAEFTRKGRKKVDSVVVKAGGKKAQRPRRSPRSR
ncbi:hypothetical protein ACFFOS_12050 [Nocardioides kongjuensis]|uniref:Uncharacterized protein n=1 Tax=Nocardioides kongjuensis TaxID=349522 RepID=A0A852R887_9ACTN|nr:hypothetical protein [Nocardioides kongjuensis]NYD29167.1 hypothetical protein [Nocardioides kongjuensis]